MGQIIQSQLKWPVYATLAALETAWPAATAGAGALGYVTGVGTVSSNGTTWAGSGATLAYSGTVSVTVAANGVFVGTDVSIAIPRGVLRGLCVEAGIPAKGAGLSGTITINWGMGSDPVLATDQDVGTTTAAADDVMASVAATTAVSGSSTVLAAYVGKYYLAAGHVHFNYIGSAATVGAGAKTIATAVKVWVFADLIP